MRVHVCVYSCVCVFGFELMLTEQLAEKCSKQVDYNNNTCACLCVHICVHVSLLRNAANRWMMIRVHVLCFHVCGYIFVYVLHLCVYSIQHT